jgi:hypothetical protein
MRTITAKVSDDLYNLFQTRAAEQGKKVGTLLKNIISEYLGGSNAQIDRLSSSIEQLTHWVYLMGIEEEVRGLQEEPVFPPLEPEIQQKIRQELCLGKRPGEGTDPVRQPALQFLNLRPGRARPARMFHEITDAVFQETALVLRRCC